MRRALRFTIDIVFAVAVLAYGAGIGLRFAGVIDWSWLRVLLWPLVVVAIAIMLVAGYGLLRDAFRELWGRR